MTQSRTKHNPAPRITSEEFRRFWARLTHRKRAEIALQASEENRTVWACFEQYLAERCALGDVREAK